MIAKEIRRIRSLSDAELEELDDALAATRWGSPAWIDAFVDRHGFPPIAGADGAGDDEEDEEEEEDEDDEDETPSAEEIAELRRKAAERDQQEARARKAEREKKELERKAREEGDDYQALYEQEKKRNDELEEQHEADRRERTTRDVATRLKFKNPDHAIRLISDDAKKDEASAERALKALARESPEYVRKGQAPPKPGDDTPPAAGGGNNGTNGDRQTGEKLDGTATLREAYAEAAEDTD